MLQATAMKTGYMADAVARFLCNFLPWLPRKVPQFQNQALIWIKHLRESFPGLRFQIYKLKIDQSFVRDLSHDSHDRTIVSAVIRMAQALGMRTTAEGVETAEQSAIIMKLGCYTAQGFFYAKPEPSHEFEARLAMQGL